jgi:hypothetical protein
MAAVFVWFLWDWLGNIGGGKDQTKFVELLWFVAVAAFALELDAAVRLMARIAPIGTLASSERSLASGPTDANGSTTFSTLEARRLARAPAYADQLERLRWLHPVLTAIAVAATAAALGWFDIPRPLDLILAAMTGLSVGAAIAVAALRGWVRLAATLSRRGAALG